MAGHGGVETRRDPRWVPRVPVSAGVAALLLLTIGACSSDDGAAFGAPVSAGDAGVGLQVRGQPASGGVLTIDEVRVSAPGGFAVVYADGEGAPGVPIGHSDLIAGSGRNVAVRLDEPVASLAKVHVIVHSDTVADGEFDIERDLPAEVGGSVVVASVEIGSEE